MLFVSQGAKRDLLVDMLNRPEVETSLVFTRTKYGADKVVRYLKKNGIRGEAIHGNKSQPQRDRAMNAFRSGKIKVLVATDIAARGIDVKGVSHVINFEIPNISETYVHRIGRTGRAGHDGVAYSMVNEGDERKHMLNIVKLIQRDIPLEEGHQWHLDLPAITLADAGGQRPAKSGGGQPQQNREGSGSGNRNRNRNRNKNRNRNRPPQGNGGPDRPTHGGGSRRKKKPKFKGPRPQGGAS